MIMRTRFQHQYSRRHSFRDFATHAGSIRVLVDAVVRRRTRATRAVVRASVGEVVAHTFSAGAFLAEARFWHLSTTLLILLVLVPLALVPLVLVPLVRVPLVLVPPVLVPPVIFPPVIFPPVFVPPILVLLVASPVRLTTVGKFFSLSPYPISRMVTDLCAEILPT